MKKILLIALIFSAIFSYSQDPTKWLREKTIEKTKLYESEVLTEDAAIQKLNHVQSMYALNLGQDLMDSVKFMWFGNAASVKRDGTNYAEIVDMSDNHNNGTQTTESSQPYVSGNIAPSTFEGMKNPNGDSRYIEHPEISFAADEAWSVTTVLNTEGRLNNLQIYAGQAAAPRGLYVNYNGTGIRYVDASTSIYLFNSTTKVESGKNNTITAVHNGTTLSIYINGIFKQSLTSSSASKWDTFLAAYSGREFYGTISAHIIRSEALTADQVLAEAEFLQAIYPEIPTVKIGEQEWAVENCEQVASSNGTVIADGSVQATWAANAAAYWCYHTDIETGSTYGKLYNKQARDVIISNPPSGWHVATEAELTTLALNGGNNLKVEGVDYWATAVGINHSGFSAIGGSSRNADGTFNAIKNTATFWCADSDNVLLLNHDDNTATITATSTAKGHSIRLVKD